tara:strand:- start:4796 stop:5674 length:879 start_codon:yes stop_codon:yes gene_type:complete
VSNNLDLSDRRFGYILTAPTVLIITLVILFPICFSLISSFFDYTLINKSFNDFIGIDNYINSFKDEQLFNSIFVTIYFVILVVLLEFILGFFIALLLNSITRFKSIYYFILLLPLLINPIVVGLIWRMFLHPQLGIFNYLLSLINIEPVNWLGDPQMAFITIIFVDIWHQVSFMIILLLAGLSAIPKEPYEAAKSDGANIYECFIHITLPYMRPVIVVTILIRLIFAIKTYDLVYIMTKGGPGDSTDLISYYIYRSAFISLNLGEAAAMSLILLVIIIIITIPLFKYMNRLD